MIGLVIVSHSARLAEGVCDLARQVAQGRVAIAAAGGTADPANALGTDAVLVLDAIQSVYGEDGVLVLMDLGSAVLSASTALELLDAGRQAHVRLCAAPLVEGAVAAASVGAAGGSLAEAAAEAEHALAGKAALVGTEPASREGPADEAEPGEEAVVTLTNRLGLHARPAARLIRTARLYRARITLENLTRAGGAAPAESINRVLGLGARQGQQVRIRARGPEAREAVAALARFLGSGCGEKDDLAPRVPQHAPQPAAAPAEHLTGIAAAAGVAVAPLVRLHPASVAIAGGVAADPDAERQRLLAALEGAREETRGLYEWTQSHAGLDEAGIFDAQMLFLEDPALLDAVSRKLGAERCTAESAWQAESARAASRLRDFADPYLSERAADVADAASRVLRRLAGETVAFELPRRPSILSAHDLTASEVKRFDPATVLGICLETGSAISHSTILARAMGIPVVTGLGPPISTVAEGTLVAIDGDRGAVWIEPDATLAATLESRRRDWLAARQAAERKRDRPAATRDGRRIRVLANISGVEDAAEALARGAEGVGVLRTEFLFLGRAAAPDEEEQAAAYRTIAEALGGRTLCIRVLDIGGDKRLPYIDIGEEANPFLGWRGIRVLLGRRDLFRTQVRAILRTAAVRPVELLLPMITSLDELSEARTVIREAEAELDRAGLPFGRDIRVGVMIEVPAAVAIADGLAREADFFSIGSNDLIQYTLAADRTNTRVTPIADPFHPAVLDMLRRTIEAGRRGGIEVALCGELAADPLATPLLLGLGIEEFSVSAPLIPGLKGAISQWSMADAKDVCREALALDTASAIRSLLKT
ncbi:MAG: phosphoenolpyruvate--protein phosphotransferase [Acidobacteria bacterium]|nr:phosphoenolpyruvate--protein phosphotransferase [Acidobacteriota bacterium]